MPWLGAQEIGNTLIMTALLILEELSTHSDLNAWPPTPPGLPSGENSPFGMPASIAKEISENNAIMTNAEFLIYPFVK